MLLPRQFQLLFPGLIGYFWSGHGFWARVGPLSLRWRFHSTVSSDCWWACDFGCSSKCFSLGLRFVRISTFYCSSSMCILTNHRLSLARYVFVSRVLLMKPWFYWVLQGSFDMVPGPVSVVLASNYTLLYLGKSLDLVCTHWAYGDIFGLFSIQLLVSVPSCLMGSS